MECEVCSKTYQSSSSLFKHMRAVHNVNFCRNTYIHCLEPGCKVQLSTIEKLRQHLEEIHKLTQFGECVHLHFSDMAGKISQGVTERRILDDIRHSADSNLNRIHLMTHKDLPNIKQSFGLEEEKMKVRESDYLSVSAWVKEMGKNEAKNIVRRLNHVCEASCAIVCKPCNACIKNFSCTCHDFVIGNNMCKHIHAISMHALDDSSKGNSVSVTVVNEYVNRETSLHVSLLQVASQSLVNTICGKLQIKKELPVDISKAIYNHLSSVNRLLSVDISPAPFANNSSPSEANKKADRKAKEIFFCETFVCLDKTYDV